MSARNSDHAQEIEEPKVRTAPQQSSTVEITDEQREIESVRREIYLNQHKALVESEEAGADQFDKNILALAAGAIAISLVFLEKIAPNPKQSTLIYLYLAWGGLIASLLFTLASFITSQHAYRRQRDILDKLIGVNSDSFNNQTNRWSIITSIFNWISIIVFIVGLSMLAVFGMTNIKASTEAARIGAELETKSSTEVGSKEQIVTPAP